MPQGQNGSKRITKRVVDTLHPGQMVWDSELKGFGVRCQARDKFYVLKTRISGRQRWFTIGRHGSPWTPDGARERALRMLSAVAEGHDLAAIRQADRLLPPTVADLCKRYLDEHAREHKKASSTKSDERNIANHVEPWLGKLLVRDVLRGDIDNFKRAVREGRTARAEGALRATYRGGALVAGGPGVANRCLALLSKMFSLAERWGWRPDGSNPVRHVEKYREGRRERFLSTEEIGRLGEALVEAEREGTATPFSIAAIRLLIFTGARLGEILTLKWEQVHLDRQMLDLPDSKTGRKQIFLSPPALQLLSELPRVAGNVHVVVGERGGAHLVNLQKPWGRIRKTARLDGVRLHDLRHSFASVAAASGLSLPIIGKLLGHTKAVTTERYAHLASDPLRAANDAIASRIADALQSKTATPNTATNVSKDIHTARS
jgi:integrase